jgi:hypothetical protein
MSGDVRAMRIASPVRRTDRLQRPARFEVDATYTAPGASRGRTGHTRPNRTRRGLPRWTSPPLWARVSRAWYWAVDPFQEGFAVHLGHLSGNDWGSRRVKNDERGDARAESRGAYPGLRERALAATIYLVNYLPILPESPFSPDAPEGCGKQMPDARARQGC